MKIDNACGSEWLWIKQCYGFDNLGDYSENNRALLDLKTARVFMERFLSEIRTFEWEKGNDFFSGLEAHITSLIHEQTVFSSCLDDWVGESALDLINRICSVWYKIVNTFFRTHFCTEKEALEAILETFKKIQAAGRTVEDYRSLADPLTGKIPLSLLHPYLPEDQYTTIAHILFKNEHLTSLSDLQDLKVIYPDLFSDTDDLFRENLSDIVVRTMNRNESTDSSEVSSISSRNDLEFSNRKFFGLLLRDLQAERNSSQREELTEPDYEAFVNSHNGLISLKALHPIFPNNKFTTIMHLLLVSSNLSALANIFLSEEKYPDMNLNYYDDLYQNSLSFMINNAISFDNRMEPRDNLADFSLALATLRKKQFTEPDYTAMAHPSTGAIPMSAFNPIFPGSTTIFHLLFYSGNLRALADILLSEKKYPGLRLTVCEDLYSKSILDMIGEHTSMNMQTDDLDSLLEVSDGKTLRESLGQRLRVFEAQRNLSMKELAEKYVDNLYELELNFSEIDSDMTGTGSTTYAHLLLVHEEYNAFCEYIQTLSLDFLEKRDDLFGRNLLEMVRWKLGSAEENYDACHECLRGIWKKLVLNVFQPSGETHLSASNTSRSFAMNVFGVPTEEPPLDSKMLNVESELDNYGDSSVLENNRYYDSTTGVLDMTFLEDCLGNIKTTKGHVLAYAGDYDELEALLAANTYPILKEDDLYKETIETILTDKLGSEDLIDTDIQGIEKCLKKIYQYQLSIEENFDYVVDKMSNDGKIFLHEIRQVLKDLNEFTTSFHLWISRNNIGKFTDSWFAHMFQDIENFPDMHLQDNLYEMTVCELIHEKIQKGKISTEFLDVFWQGVLARDLMESQPQFAKLSEDGRINLKQTGDVFYEKGDLFTTVPHLLAVRRDYKALQFMIEENSVDLNLKDSLCNCSVYYYIAAESFYPREKASKEQRDQLLHLINIRY